MPYGGDGARREGEVVRALRGVRLDGNEAA